MGAIIPLNYNGSTVTLAVNLTSKVKREWVQLNKDPFEINPESLPFLIDYMGLQYSCKAKGEDST